MRNNFTKKAWLFALLFIFIGVFFILRNEGGRDRTEVIVEKNANTTTIVKNLEIPWEIAFLPDKRMLVTERPGRLLIIDSDAKKERIREVAHVGEGGLLGMVLHPNYEDNHFIYLYYTYSSGTSLFNKVVRYRLDGEKISEDRTIIDKIPGSRNHDGGRMIFGSDRKLYISTGDAQNPSSAQDLSFLSGKILRLNDDGSIPEDNPFDDSPVFSYGHRNVQGLSWDSKGQLWATEHGSSGEDEINKVVSGSNYGWPVIRGTQSQEGMVSPVAQSGDETWAPSGGVIYNGVFYFAGLAGRAIFAFDLNSHELNKYFEGQFGRVRTINLGPDGNFYVLTSNKDGRNRSPSPEDDRIIKIAPSILEGSN